MTIICLQCSKENPDIAKFCAQCGSPVNNNPPNNPHSNYNNPPPQPNYNPNQRPMQWKNEGTTLLITVIFGIIGYGGIGHIYIGQIGKGIGLLVVGTILLVISIVLIFMLMPFIIILWIFAIWVVFDAKKQCRRYNDHLEKTGQPLW